MRGNEHSYAMFEHALVLLAISACSWSRRSFSCCAVILGVTRNFGSQPPFRTILFVTTMWRFDILFIIELFAALIVQSRALNCFGSFFLLLHKLFHPNKYSIGMEQCSGSRHTDKHVFKAFVEQTGTKQLTDNVKRDLSTFHCALSINFTFISGQTFYPESVWLHAFICNIYLAAVLYIPISGRIKISKRAAFA